MASSGARSVGAVLRHAPSVDPDRREDAPGLGADAEPLLALSALRHGAWPVHVSGALRESDVRDRLRFARPPARRAHQRRPTGDPAARAVDGGGILSSLSRHTALGS